MKTFRFILVAFFAMVIAVLFGNAVFADDAAHGPPGVSLQSDLIESFDGNSFNGFGVQNTTVTTTAMPSGLDLAWNTNDTYTHLGVGTHDAAFSATPNHWIGVETPVICPTMDVRVSSSFYGFENFESIGHGAQNVNGMIAAINDDAIAAGHVVLALAEHALHSEMYGTNVARTAERAVPEVAYYVICPTDGNSVIFPIVQNRDYLDDVGVTRSPPPAAARNLNHDTKNGTATAFAGQMTAIGSPAAHGAIRSGQINLGDIQLKT